MSHFLDPHAALHREALSLGTDFEQGLDEPQFIKLISKDGHEFLLNRDVAACSGTIRAMLKGDWQETSSGGLPTMTFEDISTPILEKVVQYMFYKKQCDNTPAPLPKFPLDTQTLVPLLIAANYLDL